MTQKQSANPKLDADMEETNVWARFTTAELETKRADLCKLVDGDMLTDRSLHHQFTEIALIEQELEKRDGR